MNDQEITDPNKIKNKIRNFDKSLFKKRNSKLDNVPLPKVNITEIIECNNELSEKKLYCPWWVYKIINHPGNNGLTKEVFVTFWEDILFIYVFYVHLFIDYYLLNVDYKVVSKAFASRLKKVLSNLISPKQTAYVENRFIGERGRLIAEITEIIDVLNKEKFLVAMDIKKAFDSLDQTFVTSV